MDYTNTSRFLEKNQRLVVTIIYSILQNVSRVVTVVHTTWLSGFYLLVRVAVFSSFSIFANLASTLTADMTATLLTTRWRTQLAPRHPGICRRIARLTAHDQCSLPLMDYKAQHAIPKQISERFQAKLAK